MESLPQTSFDLSSSRHLSSSCESVYSIQSKETARVRDSSDLSSSEYEELMRQPSTSRGRLEEFEPFDQPTSPEFFSNSSDSMDMAMETQAAVDLIAGVCSSNAAVANENSQPVSSDDMFYMEMDGISSEEDSDISIPNLAICVRCRKPNDSRYYTLCRACYKIRKNTFPPRPKATKSRKRKIMMLDTDGDEDAGCGSKKKLKKKMASGRKQVAAGSSSAVYASLMENASTNVKGSCIVCMDNPKTAGYVHGDVVHVCCCYACAKRVKRCPVCQMVPYNVKKIFVC